MARKRERNKADSVKLEMTPMIDIVFQLLIFFIVTLKQDDILSNLEALRPQADTNMATVEKAKEPIEVLVGPQGLFFGSEATRTIVSESQLKSNLLRIAKTDPNTMIVIKCTNNSPHGYLIRALDICYSVGLRKLSVFSM